jgi:beta-glucosidase
MLGADSVACMAKHFPGGGPQKDGEDPHFAYGREQVYPGGAFELHLLPFEAAFTAGVAQAMSSYGMPVGTELEEVGFAFNRQAITGLLRERYGFDGVVCADWGVLTDDEIFGKTLPARAWGVEGLSVEERALKALDAGVDQFGGEHCPEVIVSLVEQRRVSEQRLDQSVRRILRDKFRLGLFDNPYVDPKAALRIVGQESFREAGERAQRRSLVLLKNGNPGMAPLLPLANRRRIYGPALDPATAAGYGDLVGSPADADIAILRLKSPFEPRDEIGLEFLFHAGRLHFTAEELAPILEVCRAVPTVIEIFLDRPAVIPEIAAEAAALIGSFGATDAALLDLVSGRVVPQGKLPFELPSSPEAVAAQLPDLPHDSANPLFPFGFGLSY